MTPPNEANQPIYVPATGKMYASAEEFYAAESNGYVVIITSTRPGTRSAVFGPFSDKEDASKARRRLFRQMQTDERQRYGSKFKISSAIELVWKGDTS
jgi:hypothetical protein